MTIDEVARFVMTLPGVHVGLKWGRRTWMVREKGFAWQRPFTKADLKRFGDQPPPAGDILAVRVEDLDAKDALLAIAPPGFFTIPHFDGHAALLIALRAARASDVRAAIIDAWRCMGGEGAPKKGARRKGRAQSAPASRSRSRGAG